MFSDKRIEEFRATVATDLYLPDEFISWYEVEKQIQGLKPAIDKLQEIIDIREDLQLLLTNALY
ncbi:MAG TPA: hypothetical protein VGE07_29695, partial [Herpetosiphonaceae bacterium]